ncbi:hypothetical protein V8D89_013838 [Ganoderma adspersum]
MPRLVMPRHVQAKAVMKAVAAEKTAIGTRSEDCKEHLTQVRAIFAEFLGAPEDEDFVSGHTPAPRDVVEAYLNGTGFGPDRNDLCFSDLKPYNNAWNRVIASELGAILFARQSSGKWRCPDGSRVASASQPYWEDAILEKFKRLASNWRDSMCQIVTDASTGIHRRESRAEAQTRWIHQGEGQAKAARVRERRVKTLGKEGMSSDDSSSDDEDIRHQCYRVSILPWRRDFDSIMDKIDAMRFGPQSGYSARGSRPNPRRWQDRVLAFTEAEVANDILTRHREPVSLPVAFYDEKWLEGCSKDYIEKVLCIPEEAFDWVVQIANMYSTSST